MQTELAVPEAQTLLNTDTMTENAATDRRIVQSEKTIAFINAVNRVLESGKFETTYKSIAERIGYDQTSLSGVMKGRRDVPDAVYKRFMEVYNSIIEINNPVNLAIENGLVNRAMNTVILRVLAELLAGQQSKSVAAVLTDLESAVALEVQSLKNLIR